LGVEKGGGGGAREAKKRETGAEPPRREGTTSRGGRTRRTRMGSRNEADTHVRIQEGESRALGNSISNKALSLS